MKAKEPSFTVHDDATCPEGCSSGWKKEDLLKYFSVSREKLASMKIHDTVRISDYLTVSRNG